MSTGQSESFSPFSRVGVGPEQQLSDRLAVSSVPGNIATPFGVWSNKFGNVIRFGNLKESSEDESNNLAESKNIWGRVKNLILLQRLPPAKELPLEGGSKKPVHIYQDEIEEGEKIDKKFFSSQQCSQSHLFCV